VTATIQEKTVKALGALTPADAPNVGAKAFMLGRLKQSGWCIPDGFCVTRQCYEQFVVQNHLADLLDVSYVVGKQPDEFEKFCLDARAAIESERVPEKIAAVIRQACRRIIVADGCFKDSFAVRSSATVEDSNSASFAGIFETFLNVPEDQLLDHVKKCWASLWSVAALTWLRRCKAAVPDYSMAVVIQPMVKADLAGVMFTANPISGSPFQVVINSASGLGEGVVSGTAECDSFVVSEFDLSVVENATAKTINKDGLLHRSSLTDSQITALAKVGIELQREFGKPQDVEWALAGDQIYLLQSRPIVGLPPYFPIVREPEEHRFTRWKLEFPELFTHFGRSLERLKNEVHSQARSSVLGAKVNNHRAEFNGYIYHREVVQAPNMPAILFKAWQYSRWFILARTADRMFQEQIIPEFLRRSQEIHNSLASCADLYTRIERMKAAVDRYLSLQRQTVMVNVLAMAFSGAVFRLSRYLGAGSEQQEIGNLLKGVPNKTSERDELLARLVTAFHDDGLAESLEVAGTWQELSCRLQLSTSGKAFLAQMAQFDQEFGYIWADGNVKDPGWRRNDKLVMSLLRQGMKSNNMPTQDQGRKPWDGTNAGFFLRRLLLRRFVRMARRYAPYREDHNHYLSHAIMLIRETLLDCGEAAIKLKLLHGSDEIFHLTYDEIQNRLLNVRDVDEFKTLIRERALEAARQRRLTPPDTVDLEQEKQFSASLPQATELAGAPGSPGVVTGPARVLRKCDLDQVKAGDILVCHNFRPDWSPLLRYAAGLVTNQGYGLTHGASLAREWGIPAVMGVRQATTLISDGDIVKVDGNKGVIYVQREMMT
jgi:pyruvate,water dikinase